MTLYTSIGRYEIRKNAHGEKAPHVIFDNEDYELDVWEMIVWSSLMWNILTFDELRREFYKKEREVHVLGDRSCESYVDSMERNGLIRCGRGVTDLDALHDLLEKLYVVPLSANIFTKISAFIHLTLRGIPLSVTAKIFDKAEWNTTEKELIRLVKRNQLTVGELETVAGTGIMSSIPRERILAGVASLYLNKHVMFEAC